MVIIIFATLLAAKNVLLTAEGTRAKLADFDSAKRLFHELTEAGLRPLGTKGFVSREVRKQPVWQPSVKSYSVRTKRWSFWRLQWSQHQALYLVVLVIFLWEFVASLYN